MDTALADAVGAAVGSEVAHARVLGGGDVAESYRVELADGRLVFAKTLTRTSGPSASGSPSSGGLLRAPDPRGTAPPGFFTTEARGLRWLREPGAVAVPEVLAESDGDQAAGVPNHLVLEWIETGRGRLDTEADLGRGLAALHAAGAPCFGREDRRTTGSRGIPNEPSATWVEFYAAQRLLPLARLAAAEFSLPSEAIADLETLAERLDTLGVPSEPPARLHGDLWAGNRLVDASGRSWLIDPAAHGGHREFDLAMMRLFGGFGDDCFAAYAEASPLADGWEERIALHQIAPLVVHAIKFGGGYVQDAAAAIGRYA